MQTTSALAKSNHPAARPPPSLWCVRTALYAVLVAEAHVTLCVVARPLWGMTNWLAVLSLLLVDRPDLGLLTWQDVGGVTGDGVYVATPSGWAVALATWAMLCIVAGAVTGRAVHAWQRRST